MNTRHSRQSFLGNDSEKVLAQSTVAIIGLCGGGSHVAQQLAHIGIGKLVICDFDTVDETNLNRMIGSRPEDAAIAIPKTLAIKRMVCEINPNIAVTELHGNWLEHELVLRSSDVIVGCVDSYSERDNLERFCRHHKIPYIDIGMDVHATNLGFSISGQIIVSVPEGICMRCLGFLANEKLALEQANYGAAGGKPQVVWPNGVLASAAVGQLIALLSPWSNDLESTPMIEYDGNRQLLRPSSKLTYLQQHKCNHF